MPGTQPAYGQTIGLQLLNTIVENYGPLFRLDQAHTAAKGLGLGSNKVVAILSSLSRGGWVRRLKRGLYIVQSPLFNAEQHPFAIATALISPSAISHWSALAHHGMTTQIPPMLQVSTPCKVVTPEMRLGEAYRPRGRAVWKALDFEVEFVQIKQKHFFGFDQEWVNAWQRVSITDKERTCLDLIAYPEIFGSLAVAVETLENQISNLDIGRLIDYGLRYNVGSVIKRLGWILDTLGVSADILLPLKDYRVQNDYLLDPQRPRDGNRNPGWRIIENLIRDE